MPSGWDYIRHNPGKTILLAGSLLALSYCGTQCGTRLHDELCGPNQKKEDRLKSQPTTTIPCPPARQAPKGNGKPLEKRVAPNGQAPKKKGTGSGLEQKGFTLYIKDFTEHEDGVTEKRERQTPQDLYKWARWASGGDFQEVATLGTGKNTLTYIKDTKKGEVRTDIIAGKPMVEGNRLYHEDPCNGRQYNFILDHKKLKENVIEEDEKIFVDHLTRFKEATIVTDKKAKPAKGLVLYGVKPWDVRKEDGKYIVGRCPQYVGGGRDARYYWEGYNQVNLYNRIDVGPKGHPGSQPARDPAQHRGGTERGR